MTYFSLEEILSLSNKLSGVGCRGRFRDMADFYSFLKNYSFLNRVLNIPFSEVSINLNPEGYAGYRHLVDAILRWRLEIGK